MAIIRKEAYFNSSTGKNKIHCMIWQDDAVKPIALFQIAHGMSEHIERYDDFACFLAGHGFIVCGNDHLGHGKSVNSLDDLGYMDDKNGHIRMVDDMHILHHSHAQAATLTYPIFSLATAWVRFLTRRYLSAYPGKEPDGVILLGTGFPALPLVFTGEMLASLFGKRKGKHYRSVCSMSFPSETITGNSSRQRRLTTGCPGMKRETALRG